MDELIPARHDSGEDDLNRLIGELYESASSEAAWQGYCNRLANLLEADLLGLHLMSPTTGKANLYYFPASEKQREVVDRLAKQYLSEPLTIEESDQVIFSSDQRLCQVIHKEQSQYCVLLLKLDRHEALAEDNKRLLITLMPHFQRAFTIFQRFSILAASGSVLINLLDCLQVSALVCDGDGRIHYQNKLAKQLSVGSLCLPTPSNERRMGSLRPEITRRLLSAQGRVILQQEQLSLYSMPMGEPSSVGECLYLVLADDPDHTVQLNQQILRQLYGLTKSEAVLCAYMMKGLSLAEIAESLFKSEHTLKTQLKRIYKKTHCSSRSDLVRLLFLSPARWIPAD